MLGKNNKADKADDRCNFLCFCRETCAEREVVNCGHFLEGICLGLNDLTCFLECSRIAVYNCILCVIHGH